MNTARPFPHTGADLEEEPQDVADVLRKKILSNAAQKRMVSKELREKMRSSLIKPVPPKGAAPRPTAVQPPDPARTRPSLADATTLNAAAPAHPGYREALAGLRGTFLVVGLFSAAVNILMLTGPIYMLQIYDRVLSSASVATLLGLFAIVVVLYAFLGFYDFLRKRLLSRASYQLDGAVGATAFQHRLAGDPALNPLRDLDVVRQFVSGPAMPAVFDLPWIPIFLAIVFLIHPYLGWLTLGGAAIVIGAAILNQWMTQPQTNRAMALDGEERAFVENCRRSGETIAALGMGPAVVERWRQVHDRTLAMMQRGGDRSEGFSAFSRSFRLFLQSALLTVGAYLALRQEISAGMIVATSILAGRALAPVDQVIGQWRGITRALESHRALSRNLRGTPVAPYLRLPAPKGALSFENVTKLVPGDSPMARRDRILEQVAFALDPGDGLGVIGNSAAGKSTLARVIVGAWKPEVGEVRLDGATLDQWSPEDLGRHVGYLPQNVDLLPGTIAENIARFSANPKQEDVFTAARIAGVHDMILSLADGYSTRVGGAAQPLSGGQVQRIGLARAIFGDPRLVVLDEPNAHLDASGDDALNNLVEIMRARGATVVVMAHRPSALSAVNKVLILHKGRVAHFGEKEAFFKANVRPVGATRATEQGA